MSDEDLAPRKLQRVPSGVPGLDTILGGGFFKGGIYLIHARPGCGKTILGNQICFRHVASGGRALVVTLLSESHSRLLSQLETLTFFNADCVGSTLSYVSAYQALETEKLKGLLVLLRTMVRDHKATLLVIDGVVTQGAMAGSEVQTKKFIHELQVFVELVGCTTLLLTGATIPAEQYAFRTMVDGLLELHMETMGMEAARTIEVSKFRGGAVLMGRHLFKITDDGVTIYPRLESRTGQIVRAHDLSPGSSATFGIAGLDVMIAGGLRAGSMTMALGTPGSGKTLVGLSLLAAGASQGEQGLYFGFSESAADLCRKAEKMGIRLAGAVQRGAVDVLLESPLDNTADSLAEKLLKTVRERGVKRLFIDELRGFRDSLVYPERARRFFTALFAELRALRVVTVMSDDARSFGQMELPEGGLTSMIDNLVVLRHVERKARFQRVVSVMKMRGGMADASIRELSIDASGFAVAADESAAALLAEVIRESPPRSALPAPTKVRKARKARKHKPHPKTRPR